MSAVKHDIGIMILCHTHKNFRGVRFYPVIRIDKHHVFARRGIKRSVTRLRNTAVFPRYNPKTAVIRGGGKTYRAAVVGRTVIHEYCLEIAHCLRLYRRDDARKEFFHFVYRKNY